jgi:hypothetical protein
MSGGRLQFPTFENDSDIAMPSENSELRGSPAAKTAERPKITRKRRHNPVRRDGSRLISLSMTFRARRLAAFAAAAQGKEQQMVCLTKLVGHEALASR